MLLCCLILALSCACCHRLLSNNRFLVQFVTGWGKGSQDNRPVLQPIISDYLYAANQKYRQPICSQRIFLKHLEGLPVSRLQAERFWGQVELGEQYLRDRSALPCQVQAGPLAKIRKAVQELADCLERLHAAEMDFTKFCDKQAKQHRDASELKMNQARSKFCT